MRTLIILTLIGFSHGYKFYQNKIPNGELVRHPCLDGQLWPGVGHKNVNGGGARNPFGIQLAANNYNWTAICPLDADGDGVSNGEELGDPNCVWTEGDNVPNFNGNITHPGVCEPVGSVQCQTLNTFDINCQAINQYECEEYDSGIFNVTYKFDRTKVPAVETTYICQRYELPNDKHYHLIGGEAIIDNENVMHHIVAYGCPAEVGDYLSETPALCFGMAPDGCDLIGGWSFGEVGPWCPYSDIGLVVGQERYKYLYLQFHWNNPTLMDDQYDESAYRMFFTPNLRAKNAVSFVTGNLDITIPANTVRTVVEGTCSSTCTRNRIKDKTMYVYAASPHMHLLGTGATVVQMRDGQVYDTWLDQSYDYNAPATIVFDPPKELKGGDVVRTQCKFNSESRENVTKYGDGTQEEMCYVFMSYYPETIKLQHCLNGYEGATMDTCILEDFFSDDDDDDNSSASRFPSILPAITVLTLLLFEYLA